MFNIFGFMYSFWKTMIYSAFLVIISVVIKSLIFLPMMQKLLLFGITFSNECITFQDSNKAINCEEFISLLYK